ncbi:MAG: DUF6867 family protein [Rhizobiaceae bacterium]
MLHTILTGEASIGLFVLFLLCLAVAWATGRAAARSWESVLTAVVYLLLLTAAIRFLHMALYHGAMFDPVEYVVDATIALVVGIAGWRATLTTQMVEQYHWLYERSSPFSWKERAGNS